MKSLLSLVQEVLTEVGTWCGVSTIRDFKTISDRFEDEGLSFLTITLPRLGKDLQKGLDQGWVDSQLFLGFDHGRGSLPLFLGGFFDLVFDRVSGLLLNEPNIDAIFAIRQVSLMFQKINLSCTPKREKRALMRFLECEQRVRENDRRIDTVTKRRFTRLSSLLWADILTAVDKRIYDGGIVPKHGPGATADYLVGNDKYNQYEWPQRLEKYFPQGEFLFPNWRLYDATRSHMLEPGAERPVRVTPVPKTLETPRIIAIEPTAMQYVQQGISREIVDAISMSDTMDRIVGFNDQTINQRLARDGSRSGRLATLDLSDASDSVSNQHVRLLLMNHPHLFEAVDSCRSRKADVPGFGVKRLAKFASMGSALTFPLEAMIFTVIIFMGIESSLNRRLTRKDIKSLSSRVRVFGDDIIIPKEFAVSVCSSLETFGFLVNTGKSFWTGKFRESCGKEYYDGCDVSIVRVRQNLPTKRTHAQEIISTVSLRNQLYQLGLWRTVKKLDQHIESLINFPYVDQKSPVLGKHSFLGYDTERMCPQLHRPLVKGYVVEGVIPKSPLTGSDALMKFFLIRKDLPIFDRKHLERAGRPSAVRIKRKYAPSC